MSKVAWDYIVPVKLPTDLKGITPGKLPAHLLRAVPGGGKMYWRASVAWEAMVAKAKAEGVELKPTSAGDTYREYDLQRRGFLQRYQNAPIAGVKPKDFEGKKWYLKKGMAPLATPGKSQHNLGLAVDVHSASEPKRIKWLINNVKTFGFSWEVVPQEPWHIRYVCGDALPQAVIDYMQAKGIAAPAKGAPQPTSADDLNDNATGVRLKLGDKGEQVKNMQELLNKKGHQCPTSGEFCAATQKALNYFKKAVNLKPNGVCNNKTWEALND